jgi:hypothetical protein
MSSDKIFWGVFAALVAFNWCAPLSLAETHTAYFLPRAHTGSADYLPAYALTYSADRSTQSVVIQDEGHLAFAASSCVVMSSTTWDCGSIKAVAGTVVHPAVHLSDYTVISEKSVSWIRFGWFRLTGN